jgi:HK97 family phage prohead protease
MRDWQFWVFQLPSDRPNTGPMNSPAPRSPSIIGRILTREIALDPGQAVGEQRRMPCVVSTEYPVDRGGWLEVLLHEPAAVDLERVPLPLIEAHEHRPANLGLIENLRIENRQLRGDLVLGQSNRASQLWTDIKSGIVRHLSIGYQVLASRNKSSKPDQVIVTQWRPLEVSIVGVPADPFAVIEAENMPTPNIQPPAAPADENEIVPPPAPEDSATRAERRRVMEIRSIATRHASALPTISEIADADIAAGTSAAAFRARVLEEQARASERSGGHINRRWDSGHMDNLSIRGTDAGSHFIDAASDGLLLRAGIRVPEMHQGARDFQRSGLAELARVCVSRSGSRFNESSPMALFRAAMGTSDFPEILGNALNKAMRLGLEAEADSHRAWVKVTTARDFRLQSRLLLGSAPDLQPVGEFGEYTQGAMAEDKSSLQPEKFGRIVALSWEALVNDDLGAFIGIAPGLGRSAARTEADAVYDRLLAAGGAGVTMQDGLALFDVAHANTVSVATGTGKPLTAAALSAVRAKLRRQVGIGGTLLNLVPRTMIVPPERETEAEILIAQGVTHLGMASAEAATPGWLGAMRVVSDPRLVNTDVVYVVAEPSQIDCCELAVMEGHPSLEEEDEFKVDARRWKMRHVFAAGFLDHRGIVRLTITAT